MARKRLTPRSNEGSHGNDTVPPNLEARPHSTTNLSYHLALCNKQVVAGDTKFGCDLRGFAIFRRDRFVVHLEFHVLHPSNVEAKYLAEWRALAALVKAERLAKAAYEVDVKRRFTSAPSQALTRTQTRDYLGGISIAGGSEAEAKYIVTRMFAELSS